MFIYSGIPVTGVTNFSEFLSEKKINIRNQLLSSFPTIIWRAGICRMPPRKVHVGLLYMFDHVLYSVHETVLQLDLKLIHYTVTIDFR